MRHQRGRDGIFNLLAHQKFVAEPHDLAVNADTRRRVGHKQKIAATPFDKLNEPSIEFR
jgi:hypothetical protein